VVKCNSNLTKFQKLAENVNIKNCKRKKQPESLEKPRPPIKGRGFKQVIIAINEEVAHFI